MEGQGLKWSRHCRISVTPRRVKHLPDKNHLDPVAEEQSIVVLDRQGVR